MNKWFEILKTGKHVDRCGRSKEITATDLDNMVKKYDPSGHEAPLVIGHPKTNAPAYGWVDKLKRVGNRLLALPRQVAPEFAEMVSSGRFKKRSVSIYPDGTLRHVGFLGAQPPAIKGLSDIEFSDAEDFEIYEFEEQPTTPKKEADDMPTAEELQKKLDAETKAREKAEADAKTWKTRAEKTEADFSESQVAAKKKAIADFIDAGIKDGKLLPAWKEKGICEFMEAIDGVTESDSNTFEFSEGKLQTPGQWFRDFLSEFAEHPLFKEMSRPDNDGHGGDDSSVDFSEELLDRV